MMIRTNEFLLKRHFFILYTVCGADIRCAIAYNWPSVGGYGYDPEVHCGEHRLQAADMRFVISAATPFEICSRETTQAGETIEFFDSVRPKDRQPLEAR